MTISKYRDVFPYGRDSCHPKVYAPSPCKLPACHKSQAVEGQANEGLGPGDTKYEGSSSPNTVRGTHRGEDGYAPLSVFTPVMRDANILDTGSYPLRRGCAGFINTRRKDHRSTVRHKCTHRGGHKGLSENFIHTCSEGKSLFCP